MSFRKGYKREHVRIIVMTAWFEDYMCFVVYFLAGALIFGVVGSSTATAENEPNPEVLSESLEADATGSFEAELNRLKAPSAAGRNVALIIANEPAGAGKTAASAKALAARIKLLGYQLVAPSGTGGDCLLGGIVADAGRRDLATALACLVLASKDAERSFFYFFGDHEAVDGLVRLLPLGAAENSEATKDKPTGDRGILLSRLLAANAKTIPDLFVAVIDGTRRDLRQSLQPPDNKSGAIDKSDDFKTVSKSGNKKPDATKPATKQTNALATAFRKTAPELSYIISLAKAGNSNQSPAKLPPSSSLSATPLTSRLLAELDAEIDRQSSGVQARDVRALFEAAARTEAGGENEPLATGIVIANRLERAQLTLGRTSASSDNCKLLTWRSDHVGHCNELAALYWDCGKSASVLSKLETRCVKDWESVKKEGILTAFVTAMRANTCEALTIFTKKYATDEFAKTVEEVGEVVSTQKYQCAIEAAARAKKELPRLLKEANCHKTKQFLALNRSIIDKDMQVALDQVIDKSCCRELERGGKCISRASFLDDTAKRLAKKSCSVGNAVGVRRARALHILKQLNEADNLGVSFNERGAQVDRFALLVDAIPTVDCQCGVNETVDKSGECTCLLYPSRSTGKCLKRIDAIKQVQSQLGGMGCKIGTIDGKIGPVTLGYIQRLSVIAPDFKFKQFDRTGFATLATLLTRAAAKDESRVCAPFELKAETLNRGTRRKALSVANAIRHRPYAAVAVEADCKNSKCAVVTVDALESSAAAEAAALAKCQQSGKTCVISASHLDKLGN